MRLLLKSITDIGPELRRNLLIQLQLLACAFDANFGPKVSLKNNRAQLFVAQLAGLALRTIVGMESEISLTTVKEGYVSGRTMVVASVLGDESYLVQRMFISLDPVERDHAADRRLNALGQKDIIVPCQSATEKTGFGNCEELLHGFPARGTFFYFEVDLNYYALFQIRGLLLLKKMRGTCKIL